MNGSSPTLVFDLETQHLAAEVGGWDHIARMKLACAVTCHLETGAFTEYREGDVQRLLADLHAAGLVIGFNLRRFDYEVLRPYHGAALRLPTVDLLDSITRSLGFRLSLDAVASATLGRGKTATGEQAVRWYRAGQIQRVLDYCRQDVEVTRDLYEYGRAHGHLKYLDRSRRIRQVPVQW